MIAIIILALALPVPKTGQCPAGYRESGGYCAPSRNDVAPAIPKTGQCPSGWHQSGAYCLQNPRGGMRQ
jgi:hypothetical protein